jgi:importin-4
MIEVLAQTLEVGDEANARHLFDVFETLLILVCDQSTPLVIRV